MSDATVPVVRVVMHPHPDPETTGLRLVTVKGYTVVVRADDWREGQLAAFLRPDLVYQGKRVTVKTLRGVRSQGFLVPVPDGTAEGDDLAHHLGVVPYVAPEESAAAGGENVTPPPLDIPVYDLERLQNNLAIFTPGEAVVITEKIDGTNVRVVCVGDTLYVGSRQQWKRDAPGQTHWRAAQSAPGLLALVRDNPGLCVVGEGYGWVAKWRYGAQPGEVRFAAFDIWDGRTFLDYDQAKSLFDRYDVPRVPELPSSSYDEAEVLAAADGPSLIAGAEHGREGVVVRARAERIAVDMGRAVRKVVADAYVAAKPVPLPQPERVQAFDPDALAEKYAAALAKATHSAAEPAAVREAATRIARGFFVSLARKGAA